MLPDALLYYKITFPQIQLTINYINTFCVTQFFKANYLNTIATCRVNTVFYDKRNLARTNVYSLLSRYLPHIVVIILLIDTPNETIGELYISLRQIPEQALVLK